MRFSISSLKITNFRQYRGKHTIEFTLDKKKNVVIIKGKNGSGKSNLLNAITWCLYDLEVHKEGDTKYDDGMPIINAAELESLVPGQMTLAEVEIALDTENGSWLIRRQVEGGKDGLGNPYVRPKSELTVIHTKGDQNLVEQGDDTQIYINKLLPPALRSFFLIDGEQLREFFRKSTPKKIAEAIDIVSQLALLEQAVYHLHQYQSRVNKSIKDTSPKVKAIQLEIKSFEAKNAETQEAIQKGEQSLDTMEEELRDIQNYLKNHNVGRISALQGERETIDKDISRRNRELGDVEEKRNRYLVRLAPLIYLKPTIERALAYIEDKVEKGELPARIKETFVRELLDRGVCICGNDLEGESRRILETYGERLALSELSEVTIEGRITFGGILAEIDEFPQRMDEHNESIDGLKAELERKKRRRELIAEEIQEHNIDDVLRKEDRRSTLEKNVATKRQLLLVAQSDVQNFTTRLEGKKKELLHELSIDQKNEELRAKLSIAQETLEVLVTAEEIVRAKIRELVETNTQRNFFTLIRKKGAFTGVTIDENYSVRVAHVQGYNVINDLSAGEYLILGLSFMSALMSISGFQSPVIIDTPLGKIDEEHREYITTELPKFLEGTQLILLVTPTEYDSAVRRNLDQFLLPENYYEIKEDVHGIESRVVNAHGAKA